MAIQLGFLELRWTLGFDLTTEGHEVEIQYVAFFSTCLSLDLGDL